MTCWYCFRSGAMVSAMVFKTHDFGRKYSWISFRYISMPTGFLKSQPEKMMSHPVSSNVLSFSGGCCEGGRYSGSRFLLLTSNNWWRRVQSTILVRKLYNLLRTRLLKDHFLEVSEVSATGKVYSKKRFVTGKLNFALYS